MNSRSNIKLVADQIKNVFSSCIFHLSANDCKIIAIELRLPPFGKIVMSHDYHIRVEYRNPYGLDFKYFKMFFDARLKFDNASSYFYEDRIEIFHRIGNDNSRTIFENSLERANNFIQTANEVINFIKYNDDEQK